MRLRAPLRGASRAEMRRGVSEDGEVAAR